MSDHSKPLVMRPDGSVEGCTKVPELPDIYIEMTPEELPAKYNTQLSNVPEDRDEWETPQWLFDELYQEFFFGLDLCSNGLNKKADFWCRDYLKQHMKTWMHYNIRAAFMNPPYSNPLPFIKKAYEDSKLMKIVCLIKCDPSTKTWGIFWDYEKHEPKPGVQIRFLPKRLKFEYKGKPAGSSASFPSVIVIMDRRDLHE